jgi:hypothetical protein
MQDFSATEIHRGPAEVLGREAVLDSSVLSDAMEVDQDQVISLGEADEGLFKALADRLFPWCWSCQGIHACPQPPYIDTSRVLGDTKMIQSKSVRNMPDVPVFPMQKILIAVERSTLIAVFPYRPETSSK